MCIQAGKNLIIGMLADFLRLDVDCSRVINWLKCARSAGLVVIVVLVC